MKTLCLRNYRASDASAVSQLIRQVYGDYYAHPHVYLPHMISQNHSSSRWHSLVAEVGGQILGHATLFRQTASRSAELALTVVHPQSRGQNIATRLSQQLLTHAQALGCHAVSIKQVTHHPYTQRMALKLGFHNTGWLPDHVPSPYDTSARESLIIGCQNLPGYQQPLPNVEWPARFEDFKQHLCSVFGVGDQPSRWRGASVKIAQNAHRYDIALKNLGPAMLRQLQELPAHWLVSVQLGLSRHFAADCDRLAQIGFQFTGLAPGESHCEGWLALFHRGVGARRLQLYCPHMQGLHESLANPAADN